MRERFVRSVLACAVVLSCIDAVPARAQSSSGVIAGTVADPAGDIVPGVTVTCRNEATGRLRSVVTAERGGYSLTDLPPGTYTLRFDLAGFTPVEYAGIVLSIGSDVTVNVRFRTASAEQVVTVSAAPPLLETSDKSVTTTITPTQLDALPVVGRKFVNLASLAPAVTADYANVAATTDSIAFGGLSENYKSLSLEGIDLADEAVGGGTNISDASRLPIPQEAVQEFQVMANQYSVEFGRSATGVINVLGKSGTNDLSGRGYYFLKDDAFDRPNAFASGKAPYRQQIFGGSTGGPIVRDRVHFFGTYDGQDLQNVVTYTIPDFVRPILPEFDRRREAPQPTVGNQGYGRVTWTLSPTQYLSVTTLGGTFRQELAGTGGSIAADSGYTDIGKDVYVAGALSSAIGNNWTHVLRLAWSDVISERPTSGPMEAGPNVTFPSFRFGQWKSYPQSRYQQNYVVMTSTTYHRESSRVRTHDVKFGASANIVKSTYSEQRNFNGAFVFLQDRLPVAGNASTYPVLYEVRTGDNTVVEPRDVYAFAFYAEDKVTLAPGLTVTAGLRYDPQFWGGELAGEPIPDGMPIQQFWARFAEGDLGGRNYLASPTDLRTFAPRIGFAWDPLRDGRTVVRGGWGIFNAYIYTRYPTATVGTYPDFLSTAWGNDVRLSGIPNTSFPAPMPTSVLSKSGNSRVFVPVPESLSRFPCSRQLTFGVERQVGASTSVSATYNRLAGQHVMRLYNVNSRRSDGTYPVLADGLILNVYAWDGSSTTNQLQFEITHRLTRNLSFDASYAWMRAFALDTPVDASKPYDMVNWGPAMNDIRHRFVANVVYALPFGFQLGAIVAANSAAPFNVITGTDDNKDRNVNDRPIVSGVMLPPYSGRGDSYFDADVRIARAVRVGRHRAELMFEAFNLFNTVNYGQYNGNRRALNFGQPTVAMPPFQGQLGIRFDF